LDAPTVAPAPRKKVKAAVAEVAAIALIPVKQNKKMLEKVTGPSQMQI